MRKIKLFAIGAVLVSILVFGSPGISRAAGMYETPPAIVFVQDRDNKSLVKHHFVYDPGMLIPGESSMDKEFYINIPD